MKQLFEQFIPTWKNLPYKFLLEILTDALKFWSFNLILPLVGILIAPLIISELKDLSEAYENIIVGWCFNMWQVIGYLFCLGISLIINVFKDE